MKSFEITSNSFKCKGGIVIQNIKVIQTILKKLDERKKRQKGLSVYICLNKILMERLLPECYYFREGTSNFGCWHFCCKNSTFPEDQFIPNTDCMEDRIVSRSKQLAQGMLRIHKVRRAVAFEGRLKSRKYKILVKIINKISSS